MTFTCDFKGSANSSSERLMYICLGLDQDFFILMKINKKSELLVSCLGGERGSCQSQRGFTKDASPLKWLVFPTSQSLSWISLLLDHLQNVEELICLIMVHLVMIPACCFSEGGIYHSGVLQRVM